jgi:prepilin-type N-terminal cleavage/methylation domain-containing protein
MGVNAVITYGGKSRRRGGFTLVEVLIVIIVIAVLAVIVIPRLIAAQRQAKEARLRGNLKQLRVAIEQFEATTGAWPPALADVMATSGTDISADLDGRGGWIDRSAYNGPYLVTGSGNLPNDPFTLSADWAYSNTGGDVHSSSDLTAVDGTSYTSW